MTRESGFTSAFIAIFSACVAFSVKYDARRLAHAEQRRRLLPAGVHQLSRATAPPRSRPVAYPAAPVQRTMRTACPTARGLDERRRGVVQIDHPHSPSQSTRHGGASPARRSRCAAQSAGLPRLDAHRPAAGFGSCVTRRPCYLRRNAEPPELMLHPRSLGLSATDQQSKIHISASRCPQPVDVSVHSGFPCT